LADLNGLSVKEKWNADVTDALRETRIKTDVKASEERNNLQVSV
jgi:hypothetical protein